MKRMKKILSLAVAMVMMLAMSVTAFAAEEATIKVNNAEKATLTYAQVIKADTTTETGWDIVDEYASTFEESLNVSDEQAAITAFIEANASVRSALLAKIPTSAEMSNPQTVTSAGLYVINATEDGYTYEVMAAYVGMDYDGAVTGLVSTEVNAKKAPVSVDKTIAEEDAVVEKEQVVNYTITSTVPYVDPAATNQVYSITDTISGAEYVLNDEGKLELSVSVNGAEATAYTADVTVNADGTQTFTVDLTNVALNEDGSVNYDNLNKSIVITYAAKVVDLTVNNKAYPNVGDHDFSDKYDETNSYTASIEVTKLGENGEALEGAEFVIINAEGLYAVLSDGKLVSWTEDIDEASHITTGADGKATAYGFDKDLAYKVLEVVAPNGYSVNTNEVDVTFNQATAGDDSTWAGTATVNDTKLSSLPFTGGIGTTIFTVLGVAIMVAAAALFFATKKKSTK